MLLKSGLHETKCQSYKPHINDPSCSEENFEIWDQRIAINVPSCRIYEDPLLVRWDLGSSSGCFKSKLIEWPCAFRM